MKYIRRAIIIILVAIFLAAALIGVSVIFAVRNINVAVVSYSSAAEGSSGFNDSVNEIKDSLTSLNGKNLINISEDDVTTLITTEGYARYVSVGKAYPCTLNVTLEERLETFAVLSEEKYLVYDELGEYIATKEGNINNLDGCPNVLVESDCDLTMVASIAAQFNQTFSSLRSLVESITIESYTAENSDVFTFKFYSGPSLRLVNYSEYTSEKIDALYKAYQSLDDFGKTGEVISCYDNIGKLYITLSSDGSIYPV